MVQKDDYYPFGLAFNNGYQRVTAKKNDFLYNGKEKIDDLDLGWYDYGWRMYQPEIGRWAVIDPLSEKYLTQSPYSMVANNPIKYIDDNGKDFAIYFEKNKDGNYQIRISATYYFKKGDKDSKNSALSAIKSWNSKNNYSLEVKGDDGEKSQIGIVFDLNVKEVEDPEAEKKKDISGSEDAITKDGSSNVYSAVDKSEIKSTHAEGETENKYRIRVPRDASNKVGVHEIGHTLGLDDKGSGVMSGGSDNSIRNWDVRDIIKFAIKTQRTYPNNRRITVHGKIPDGKVKTTKQHIKQYEE